MENIILGLLLLQPRTIYQLRKRINNGLNLMYSCSTGSIQAAIKKLLRSGYISVKEINENGKLKKLYSITADGKKQFDLWVNSPIDSNLSKNPELTKIYFMGFAEKESRIKLLENHIAALRKNYCYLDTICKEAESLSAKMKGNEIFNYQLETAKYGREFMQFNIEWYSHLLENVRSN